MLTTIIEFESVERPAIDHGCGGLVRGVPMGAPNGQNARSSLDSTCRQRKKACRPIPGASPQ